jgi:hypothetical protein
MTDGRAAPSLRRGLLWGLLTGAFVALAGAVAKESLATIAMFSVGTALLMGWGAYQAPTVPPRAGESPDLGWILWVLRTLRRLR